MISLCLFFWDPTAQVMNPLVFCAVVVRNDVPCRFPLVFSRQSVHQFIDPDGGSVIRRSHVKKTTNQFFSGPACVVLESWCGSDDLSLSICSVDEAHGATGPMAGVCEGGNQFHPRVGHYDDMRLRVLSTAVGLSDRNEQPAGLPAPVLQVR